MADNSLFLFGLPQFMALSSQCVVVADNSLRLNRSLSLCLLIVFATMVGCSLCHNGWLQYHHCVWQQSLSQWLATVLSLCLATVFVTMAGYSIITVFGYSLCHNGWLQYYHCVWLQSLSQWLTTVFVTMTDYSLCHYG